MKTIVLMLTLGLGVSTACLGVSTAASAAELGLITGSENGTYYQFGVDLKRLVRPAGPE